MAFGRWLVLITMLALALPAERAAPAARLRSTELAETIAGRPLVVGAQVFFVRPGTASERGAILVHDSAAGTTRELSHGRFEAASPVAASMCYYALL